MADERVTHEEMLSTLDRAIAVELTLDDRPVLVAIKAQLEARRWRDRVDAPDTDDPILGYSPIAGNPAEDEECGHYAITSGSFLQSGGWENCTLWKPISPPSATSEGGESVPEGHGLRCGAHPPRVDEEGLSA